MLTRLTVRNYALISELDIEFGSGLTIITGETGAGKSILLGALGLVLGQRADLGALLDKKKKCTVEAWFDISSLVLERFFTEHDLDHEPVSCLRREINPEGKSRAFINDTPVNISVLKDLSARLIDIHSQHENLLLQDSGFRMGVLDSIAATVGAVSDFTNVFRKRQELIRRLNELKESEKNGLAQADYLQFQLNELDEANLKEGELEALEKELELLQHSEEIKKMLLQAAEAISADGQGLSSGLLNLFSSLNSIGKISSKAAELAERVRSLRIELQDIAAEIDSLESSVQADPGRQLMLSDRIDLINRLLSKHRQNDTAGLLELRNAFEQQLQGFMSVSDDIIQLEKQLNDTNNQMEAEASEIRKKRLKAIGPAEKKLGFLLQEVGMKHAGLKLQLEPLPVGEYRIDGADALTILFSANKGIEFKEISKVASGGELSRLMLCIKSLIAHVAGLPTLVFDEIDTGISGEVAGRVGTIVKSVSRERQVIAITHLPQMAGKGDAHLHVYKDVGATTTRTAIRVLKPDERIHEIARMLSGDQPSKAAMANARELLEV